MSRLPPRYFKVPKYASPAPIMPAVKRLERGSPRLRGLSSKWDKMSIEFRKSHPFCRMCEQEGRDSFVDVVDHVLPRSEYPGLTLEWSNLQGLCRHHDGIKQKMEDFARKHGLLERLTLWCSSFEARPAEFTGGINPQSAFEGK